MGNTKSLMIYPALCARISSFLEKGNSARARARLKCAASMKQFYVCAFMLHAEIAFLWNYVNAEGPLYIHTYILLYALHLCIFEKFPSQYAMRCG